MKLIKNLTTFHSIVIGLLVCATGVLGFLFYESNRTNIQNRELIADSKIENKDISQDLEIVKDKYNLLKTEVDVLKNKVRKVSYKKKTKKRKHLYSAGKSSKYKNLYKRHNVNYKKLYFQLKKKCDRRKSAVRNYSRIR